MLEINQVRGKNFRISSRPVLLNPSWQSKCTWRFKKKIQRHSKSNILAFWFSGPVLGPGSMYFSKRSQWDWDSQPGLRTTHWFVSPQSQTLFPHVSDLRPSGIHISGLQPWLHIRITWGPWENADAWLHPSN